MERLEKKVRELRKKMDWAQEDLAREIGVSLSTVQRSERQYDEPTGDRVAVHIALPSKD